MLCLDTSEARESNEVRSPVRGAQPLDDAAAAGVRCRRRRAVACGRWVHWLGNVCWTGAGVRSEVGNHRCRLREPRAADASFRTSWAAQEPTPLAHCQRIVIAACASKHGESQPSHTVSRRSVAVDDARGIRQQSPRGNHGIAVPPSVHAPNRAAPSCPRPTSNHCRFR
jgi:hypothetical protein